MVQYRVNEQQEALEHMVLNVIKKHNCRKVSEVVTLMQKIDKSIKFDDIKSIIDTLQAKSLLTFKDFIFDIRNGFVFWLTTSITLATLTSIYLLPSSTLFIRWIIGSIFVLFMPGYSLVKILFRDMHMGLSITLGIVLSIALAALVGLILNAFIGIRLIPIVAILSTISITMAMIHIYNMYAERKSRL